ncbi:MAG: DUF4321 domain-containing protein [Candidatus Marinimicrobia bacterium]|jgi:hypothetical protein|nr:DUF4321 domain-containing protein [Candidatus Neomarinimicrobiota bacterium]
MKKRSWGYITLGLFVGALIGSLLGSLLGWILPAGVVKDFFLLGVNFDLAGLVGNDSGVIVLDLIIITFKFGLSIAFNFTSLIGLATAYYFLRFFH